MASLYSLKLDFSMVLIVSVLSSLISASGIIMFLRTLSIRYSALLSNAANLPVSRFEILPPEVLGGGKSPRGIHPSSVPELEDSDDDGYLALLADGHGVLRIGSLLLVLGVLWQMFEGVSKSTRCLTDEFGFSILAQ